MAIIRYAAKKDVPELVSMVKGLLLMHICRFRSFSRSEMVHNLDEVLGKDYLKVGLPKKNVLVAEAEGEIVGFCEFEVSLSSIVFKKRRYLYLHDLFIKQGYRKRGIGRMLMQRLAEIAKERKCAHSRIELDVDAGNKEALAFYNKFGFKPGKRVRLIRQVK